jgi:hypothetical protein
MKRIFGVFLVLCVVAYSFAFLSPTHAQTDTGALYLTTSPLPISLVAKPGETVTADIRVKNGGTKPEVLKVGLMKFTSNGTDGKPKLAEREPGDAYFDWVNFSKNTFVAQPNEWQTVKITITIPKTAAFGYYYAVTFSRANIAKPTNPREQTLQGGTAVLVLLDAKVPNAQRTMAIDQFTINRKSYEFLPATFTVRVKNNGNVHGIPSGNIFITRGGKAVATLDVNKPQGNVLPQSSREFTSMWEDGFPVYKTSEKNGAVVLKNGKPVQNLTWNFSQADRLRFGRYTARAVVVYSDGTRDVPMEAVVSFWVIPWRLIGMVLVPIAIIAILLIGYLRLRRKLHNLQQPKQKVVK